MLAAGGAGGDCLAQESPGAEVLRSPEPNFFVVGAKSYGRGSAFLLVMGYEQVEQVVGLCGDSSASVGCLRILLQMSRACTAGLVLWGRIARSRGCSCL